MPQPDFDYDFHNHHEIVQPLAKYQKKGLTGLVNLGNKCFMNSIIQCMSNTIKLTDYFLSENFKQDDPEQLNNKKKQYAFVKGYINLLINIWDYNQILRPKSFVEVFSQFVKKYYTLEQQDSHECLMYFLNLLHEGLSYEIDVEIKGEVKTETDALMKLSLETWKTNYEKQYSFVIDCFNGLIYNNISCTNCEFKENVFEPCNSISITIPEQQSTLTECLEQYFTPNSVCSWTCEKCEMKGCTKNCTLWSLPNYVIIHLKRFTNDGRKLNTKIDFTLDDLNLTPFVCPEKQDSNNYIYTLYAVNYHSGNVDSGHYWSACKNLDNNWYLFNDGNTSKYHNTIDIVTKDAYILFYYRKFIKS